MPPGQGTGDAGHVLFVQQPIVSYAAILLSTLFPGDVRANSQHVAVYIANRLSADSAIALSLLPSGLQDRQVVVRRGRQIFPLEGAPRVGDGDNIIVEVLPQSEHDPSLDGSSLLQIESGWKHFQLVPDFLQHALIAAPGVTQHKLDGVTEPPCFPTIHRDGAATVDRTFVDLPAGLREMREAFSLNAAVANEEQGPTGFVDTWYLGGNRPIVTEHSRVLKLDLDLGDWEPRIRELWRDTIDWTQPLWFLWVHPVPIALITRHRIGHLLMVQSIEPPLVPVHLTLLFAGRGRERIGFAAALLNNPASVGPTRDLLQLARVCLARHCTLRFQHRTWNPQDSIEVQPGAGLEFLVMSILLRMLAVKLSPSMLNL